MIVQNTEADTFLSRRSWIKNNYKFFMIKYMDQLFDILIEAILI